MTTYNTGNPVGSTAVKDLYDNSQNLDLLTLGPLRSYPDRLGTQRYSWAGIEQQFDDFLLNSGFVFTTPSTYAAGITINGRNEVFAKDGVYYSAGPTLTLPYTTTGNWAVEGPLFTPRDDAILRSQLANTADPSQGVAMVGRGTQSVNTVADLRALLTSSASVNAETLGYYAVNDGGHGRYYLDTSDTTSTDDGLLVIVAADGGRWKLRKKKGYINVLQAGAVADGDFAGGGTENCFIFQKCADASLLVRVPAGLYKCAAATVQLQPNGRFDGDGMLKVRIMRSGNRPGHTFQIGTADASIGALECAITGMLIEQLHPGYVIGVSSTMVDRLTGDQSHIACFGGYNCEFKDLWFQHGVYGLSLYGCVIPKVSDIRSYGSWDNKNTAVSEQKAAIRLAENQAIPSHKYNTEARIERVYVGGGGPSAPRTITVGNVTYTDYENIGAQYGILIEGCEGFEITNSYVGGCGGDCIAFFPYGLVTMGVIDNVFLDECYSSHIRFFPATNPVTNICLGPGVRCNGQLHTRWSIRAEANGGTPTVYGLSITGGTYLNTLESPFVFLGALAVTVTGAIVGGYNAKGATDSNPIIAAGAYVGQLSRNVHFQGGLWGGAVNNWATPNNCQWGVYFENAGYGSVSNIRGIIGMAGGSVVGGITQTYPT